LEVAKKNEKNWKKLKMHKVSFERVTKNQNMRPLAAALGIIYY
jgi:hypothetical protein